MCFKLILVALTHLHQTSKFRQPLPLREEEEKLGFLPNLAEFYQTKEKILSASTLSLAYRFLVCENVEGSSLKAVPIRQTSWWSLETKFGNLPSSPLEFRHTRYYFDIATAMFWLIILHTWSCGVFSVWILKIIPLPDVYIRIEKPNSGIRARLVCLD